MSATVVMPDWSASSAPSIAESSQSWLENSRSFCMSCSFHCEYGQVVDEAAHGRVLEVGVQVDEARHDRREAEVAHRLVGMERTQVLEVADLDDPVASDQHRAVLDVGRGDGQHVACGEQHGSPPVSGSCRFYRSRVPGTSAAVQRVAT